MDHTLTHNYKALIKLMKRNAKNARSRNKYYRNYITWNPKRPAHLTEKMFKQLTFAASVCYTDKWNFCHFLRKLNSFLCCQFHFLVMAGWWAVHRAQTYMIFFPNESGSGNGLFSCLVFMGSLVWYLWLVSWQSKCFFQEKYSWWVFCGNLYLSLIIRSLGWFGNLNTCYWW